MKKFYLFQQRGITDSYFCGNVYEKLPTDIMTFEGMITFNDCVIMGLAMVFDTKKECIAYSDQQEEQMDHENNYARNAMECESVYGCEGVDDMRYEN